MKTARRLQQIVSLPLALLMAGAHAQPVAPPDAGALRQQLEQNRLPALPPAQRPAPAAAESAPPAKSDATIRVKAFRFTGNTLLSNEQLAEALASYLARPLSFDDLQSAANAVSAAYRSANRLAQVTLPAQDITEGVVTLAVVEARFEGLRFESELPRRVKPALIEGIFNAQQAVGQPLDAAALDRALLLADDLPGVNVAATLAAGAQQGETALVLRTTDQLAFQGSVSLDNTGARATGAERLAVNLQLNSPTGRGEAVNLNLLHSRGSDYGRAALTVPVGSNGLRLGTSVSYLSYEVIDGPASNSAAQIKGNSGSFGFDALYPLVRDRTRNLYLTAGLDNKTFVNSDTQLRSDYGTRSLSLGLSGNRFDSLGGSGANSGALQLTLGRLTDMKAHTQLDTIERSYSKINYALSRQQALGPTQSLLFSFSGQHATQALDSSEKLYIGGAQSVRAYPVSEFGGDRGQAFTAEWRWALAPAWALTAFADVARVVSLPAAPSDPTTTRNLRGYGLRLGWQGPQGLNTRLTWARRIGDNPQPTATGTDGDGSLKLNRFWLSTTLPF
jgi:hemolysin activation/secretion protein